MSIRGTILELRHFRWLSPQGPCYGQLNRRNSRILPRVQEPIVQRPPGSCRLNFSRLRFVNAVTVLDLDTSYRSPVLMLTARYDAKNAQLTTRDKLSSSNSIPMTKSITVNLPLCLHPGGGGGRGGGAALSMRKWQRARRSTHRRH